MDCFGQMDDLNFFTSFQIGNRSGNLKDSVMGTCGEPQFFNGLLISAWPYLLIAQICRTMLGPICALKWSRSFSVNLRSWTALALMALFLISLFFSALPDEARSVKLTQTFIPASLAISLLAIGSQLLLQNFLVG